MKFALTVQRSLIISSILSVLLYVSLHISHSHAAESPQTAVAQVIWTKGGVEAEQPGQSPRALQRRSVVYEGDTITTNKEGSGELSFVDNGVVALNPDSEFKVDEYKFKKNAPAEDKSVMTLVKGGFRTITGTIPKENPDAYKIHTPVATIGVRGTQYATVFSPTKGLLLKIERGVIDVTNGAGKIELSKCVREHDTGTNNCNEYGIVTSFNVSPTTTSVMPPELTNVTPVSPVPAGLGTPMNSPSSSPGGPAKTVSNFCVGLLKEIYTRVNQFFS